METFVVSAFMLLFVLGSSNAGDAEKFWTWEPLEKQDLSTMEPTWDVKEINSRIFICRVKCDYAEGEYYDLGTYEHPPTNYKPENACIMSFNVEPFFMNETDKSKIEILKYPREKVEWTSIKIKYKEYDEIEGLRPRFVPLGGHDEDNTYACRFHFQSWESRKSEAYIGYVSISNFSQYSCVAAYHNGKLVYMDTNLEGLSNTSTKFYFVPIDERKDGKRRYRCELSVHTN